MSTSNNNGQPDLMAIYQHNFAFISTEKARSRARRRNIRALCAPIVGLIYFTCLTHKYPQFYNLALIYISYPAVNPMMMLGRILFERYKRKSSAFTPTDMWVCIAYTALFFLTCTLEAPLQIFFLMWSFIGVGTSLWLHQRFCHRVYQRFINPDYKQVENPNSLNARAGFFWQSLMAISAFVPADIGDIWRPKTNIGPRTKNSELPP